MKKKTGAYSRNRLYLRLSGYGQRLLETYTYLLKGGVFANAQTGNFALLGMAIAHGDVKKVFTYLIPMCFYVIGIALTVTMPRLLDENKLLRWDTVFVALEIGLLFMVGCLPKSVPFTVSTVTVAFICAMQYNTFKRTNNMAFFLHLLYQQSAPTGAAFSGLSAHQGAPEPKEQSHLYVDQRFLFAGGSDRYPVRPLVGRSGSVGVLRRSGAGVAVADLWQAGGRERTAGRGETGDGRGRTRFGRRAAGIAGRE